MKSSFPKLVLSGLLLGVPALAGSCSSDSSQEKLALAKLSEGCIINSDCASPLVCAFKRCHTECESSRDCDPGQRCVLADRPFHVCQLPEETACTFNSDCPEGQLCGVDGECRDQCSADRDCVVGQLCVTGTCAEPDELDENGQLPVSGSSNGSVGQPCSYTSECPEGLVCRSGLCGYQCQTSADCEPGKQCVNRTCTVPTCDSVGGSPVDAGAPCHYDSQCPAGLVCRFGTCTCECVSDDDCPGSATCVGNRCSAPDGGDGGSVATGLPDWTRTTASGSYALSAMAAGPDGKLFITGTFFGTVSFGAGDLSSGGASCNALVLVYDDQGGVQSARPYGGTGCLSPSDLAVDADGNVYLVGTYTTDITLGTYGFLAPAAGNRILVAKLLPNGGVEWAKSYGASTWNYVEAIAASNTGDVVFTGSIYEPLDFGAGLLPHNSGQDVFAAALDASGNHLWSKAWGTAGQETGSDVTFVGSDALVVGRYETNLDFGLGPVVAGGTTSADGFVLRLDASGNPVSSQGYVDSNVLIQHGSSFVVSGWHAGGVSFGGDTFPEAGVFVARYDDAGAHQWSVSFPSASANTAGLATTGSGDVVIAGQTDSSIDFGAGPIVGGVESEQAFVVKLARDTGNVLWSHGSSAPPPDAGLPGSGGILVNGLSADAEGNSYLSIDPQGIVDFLGFNLRGSGNSVLIKLLP